MSQHGHADTTHGDDGHDCCEHGHGHGEKSEHGHGQHEEKEHGHGHGHDDHAEKKEHGHGHGHSHGDGHESEVVALGTVTLGGVTFVVDREGQIESGKTSTFGVELIDGTKTATPSDAWLESSDGQKMCDPATGEGHDQHWHFAVTPTGPASKFVLRVGEETASVDLSAGATPCNGGILTVLEGEQGKGYLELKLHDDAGDLELWLYSSTLGGKPTPLDVPTATVVAVTFPSHGDKAIEMRIRNAAQNEDEAGTPNMRGGGTNYFIFPGESGADPAWLQGEKWRGVAKVSFEVDGKPWTCDPFVVVPHTAL